MTQNKIIVNPENPTGITLEFTAEDTASYNAHTKEHLDRRKVSDDARTAEATLKASAKAKLIAGEALTEAEANTIVL